MCEQEIEIFSHTRWFFDGIFRDSVSGSDSKQFPIHLNPEAFHGKPSENLEKPNEKKLLVHRLGWVKRFHLPNKIPFTSRLIFSRHDFYPNPSRYSLSAAEKGMKTLSLPFSRDFLFFHIS